MSSEDIQRKAKAFCKDHGFDYEKVKQDNAMVVWDLHQSAKIGKVNRFFAALRHRHLYCIDEFIPIHKFTKSEVAGVVAALLGDVRYDATHYSARTLESSLLTGPESVVLLVLQHPRCNLQPAIHAFCKSHFRSNMSHVISIMLDTMPVTNDDIANLIYYQRYKVDVDLVPSKMKVTQPFVAPEVWKYCSNKWIIPLLEDGRLHVDLSVLSIVHGNRDRMGAILRNGRIHNFGIASIRDALKGDSARFFTSEKQTFVRQCIGMICMSLYPLNLPILQLVFILDFYLTACGLEQDIPTMYITWEIAKLVKHRPSPPLLGQQKLLLEQ